MTRANAQALGFDPLTSYRRRFEYDSTELRDGSIVSRRNRRTLTAVGRRPSLISIVTTITPGFLILWVLCFTRSGMRWVYQGVDARDAALDDPAGFRDINLSPLDMFRLEPSDG